jgi:hypothetical protein
MKKKPHPYSYEVETLRLSLYDEVKEVLNSLQHIFMAQLEIAAIGENEDIFSSYQKMLNESSTSGDSLEKNYHVACQHDAQKNVFDHLKLMFISCAFCAEAMRSAEAKNYIKAWTLIGDAKHWLGRAVSIIEIKKHGMMPPTKVKQGKGCAGARARDSKYGPLRELTRALALANQSKFHSGRQVALNFAPKIGEEAGRLGIYVSPTQIVATITTWLKKMGFVFAKVNVNDTTTIT